MPQRAEKQLEWSARSERDFLAIDAYISTDDPVAAEHVVDYILSQVELLTRSPLMGRIPKPGAPRELIFTRYPTTSFTASPAAKSESLEYSTSHACIPERVPLYRGLSWVRNTNLMLTLMALG